MNRVPLSHGLALCLLVLTTSSARAGDDCDAPPDSWQPRSALNELAQRNSWQIDRVKIDDGCYEIVGRDADGRAFKAKVDPASLQVLGVKHGRHDRDRDRDRERRRGQHDPATPASTSGDPR